MRDSVRQRLAFAAQASYLLSSSLQLESTVEQILQLASPQLADWCLLWLELGPGQPPVVACTHPDTRLQAELLSGADVIARMPLCREAMADGRIRRTSPTRQPDTLTFTNPPPNALLNSVDLVCVPIAARAVACGFLLLGADSDPQAACNAGLAQELVRVASIALENVRLYREAQEATRARQESLSLLDSLLRNSPVAMAQLDGALRCVRANPAMSELLSVESPEESVGRTLRALNPALDAKLGSVCKTVLQSGAPVLELEVSGVGGGPPGEEGYYLANVYRVAAPEGCPETVGITLTDISQRRRAEEALHHVMSSALCLFWAASIDRVADDPPEYDWKIRIFDEEGAMRFLPVTMLPGETYTNAWTRARHPEDRVEADRLARTVLDSGGTQYRQPYRCLRADGEWRWLQEHAYVQSRGPRRWRIVGVCVDITHLKQMEQKLRQQRDLLRDADRRKDEFLATLAHELRNPLFPALNAAELLQMRPDDPESVLRSARVVERQVRHMSRLIEDLLDVARIAQGKVPLDVRSIAVAPIVDRAVEAVEPAVAARRQSLAVTVQPGLPPIEADATRLEQILRNLLQNAAKYTPEQGRLDLRVWADNGSICLKVSDTGIGIRQESLPEVFELFSQVGVELDPRARGLGLGLPLVKRLVELHGGTVQASSGGPNLGSDFVVTLPLRYQSRTEDPEDRAALPDR